MSGDYTLERSGTCRACGKGIHWFLTPSGRFMPVDDQPGQPLPPRFKANEEEARRNLIPNFHYREGGCRREDS